MSLHVSGQHVPYASYDGGCACLLSSHPASPPNAVSCWYTCTLYGGIQWSTAAAAPDPDIVTPQVLSMVQHAKVPMSWAMRPWLRQHAQASKECSDQLPVVRSLRPTLHMLSPPSWGWCTTSRPVPPCVAPALNVVAAHNTCR
jgi:hypothetical protein